MSNLIHRQSLNLGFYDDFKYAQQPQHLFYLSNKVASSKAIKLLSALTHSIFNTRSTLYELARLFAALSLHELRKQNNINDRVIIAMTEKFTLVQLSSEKISYRHDAPHKPAH
jgi:hypothetical protein